MSRFVHPEALSEIVTPIPGGAVVIWAESDTYDATPEQIAACREYVKGILEERIVVCTVGVEVRLGGSRGKLVLGTAYLFLCEIDLHKDVDAQIREYANDNYLIGEALNEATDNIDGEIEKLGILRAYLRKHLEGRDK